MVIAYLMQEKGMSIFEAMSLVKSKRSCIFPNPGFQRQLLDFERKLAANKKATVNMIDSLPSQKQQIAAYNMYSGSNKEKHGQQNKGGATTN